VTSLIKPPACERSFDRAKIRRVLSVHEIESLRRSNAMAPLSQSHVRELIDACAEMARERQAIADVLVDLPTSFAEVRTALNQLQQIVVR
jgi:hypothetical protein